MDIPPIDLFEWLQTNGPKAAYNLALSNAEGLTWQEYENLTGFPFPKDFDLGRNEHYGATELKNILSTLYQCSAENIVTTTGATEANFLVCSSLITHGDDVLIEQPGYQPMWLTPQLLGARRIDWVRSFENRYHLNINQLQERITKKTRLIILTNLHNPSGILSDRKTIEAVAEIAKSYHASVLIDEIFLDGAFTPVSTSFGIDNVIVTSSLTKVYGLGGLHTGWIIAPKELAMKCQQMKAHTTATSSYVSEIMAAHILGHAQKEIQQRFQHHAQKNLGILKQWMQQHTDLFTWVEPDGGIVCFPKYTIKIPSLELCRSLLEHHGVLVNPGLYFHQEGHLRLSYGGDTELLQKGLDRIEKGMHDMLTTRKARI